MQLSWLVKLRSIFYSLVLHLIAAALLVFSFSFTEIIQPPPPANNVVNAVTVDRAEVEKELQRLEKEEQDKKQEEKKRISELEKQAEELKKLRMDEEKKLLDAKKKKEEEVKRREEEQKKLVQLEKEKEELEKQRKLEEEKKKKAEEEKRKAEEEKKRLEEERKKQEEEKKKQAAEKALQEQLAAEQAEEQRQQDLTLQQQIARDIYNKVTRNFNRTGLPEGLSCALRVKLLPGGEVIDVSVSNTSGNDIFDRRALTAVQKASPLPVPQDTETFERLNLRDITFTFKP